MWIIWSLVYLFVVPVHSLHIVLPEGNFLLDSGVGWLFCARSVPRAEFEGDVIAEVGEGNA